LILYLLDLKPTAQLKTGISFTKQINKADGLISISLSQPELISRCGQSFGWLKAALKYLIKK